jgi:hypothetical protein
LSRRSVLAAVLVTTLAAGYVIPAARRRDDVDRLAANPALQAVAAHVKRRGMLDVSPVHVFAVATRLERFRSDPAHCAESPWRGEVVYYTLFMIPILRVDVTCGGESWSWRAGFGV